MAVEKLVGGKAQARVRVLLFASSFFLYYVYKHTRKHVENTLEALKVKKDIERTPTGGFVCICAPFCLCQGGFHGFPP